MKNNSLNEVLIKARMEMKMAMVDIFVTILDDFNQKHTNDHSPPNAWIVNSQEGMRIHTNLTHTNEVKFSDALYKVIDIHEFKFNSSVFDLIFSGKMDDIPLGQGIEASLDDDELAMYHKMRLEQNIGSSSSNKPPKI